MRTYLAATLAALALSSLAACSGDDATTAEDPATTAPSPEGTTTEAGDEYPQFAPEDYIYTLEVVCFCPVRGPVRVTVEDGEAVEAVTLRSSGGVAKGEDAPEYYLKTINDIIAAANDPEADQVDVTWPEGQDWPSKVAVDHDQRAVDEEMTYEVRDVEVAS